MLGREVGDPGPATGRPGTRERGDSGTPEPRNWRHGRSGTREPGNLEAGTPRTGEFGRPGEP